jgi:predicted O-methyltransferase YrrM
MRHYPKSYTASLPEWLASAHDPPSDHETRHSAAIRREFLFANDKPPFMTDVVRAMRLLAGRGRYVEVGTYDKGCLAYVSTILSADALLVDVDMTERPDHATKLSAFVRPSQRVKTILGDSAARDTIEQVKSALGPGGADAIFIDGNHTAAYAWADYSNYFELLAPGGLMLFHDIYWQGTPDTPGVSHAMEWISRVHAVYCVHGNDPLHRFFPVFDRAQPVWGGVGIIRKE